MFWDGREIGTTAVCRKTLSPVWFAGPGAGNKQPKNLAGSPVAQEEKPYFWLESTCSANPRLRVELYDWDAVGEHDFLGGVELDMAELVELQRATLGKARANGGNTDQQVRKAASRAAPGVPLVKYSSAGFLLRRVRGLHHIIARTHAVPKRPPLSLCAATLPPLLLRASLTSFSSRLTTPCGRVTTKSGKAAPWACASTWTWSKRSAGRGGSRPPPHVGSRPSISQSRR